MKNYKRDKQYSVNSFSHSVSTTAMNSKYILGTHTWLIFLDVSLLGATQNTVANIPQDIRGNRNDNISGIGSDGWPMSGHHKSKITMETMNGADITGKNGDDLSDEELRILLPLLIQNTFQQTNSRRKTKGSKKKNGRRGHWKKLTKSHPEISQIFGDKNPLVTDPDSENKLRLVAQKHFQLVNQVEERKQYITKQTQARTKIANSKKNNQDSSNTKRKEDLSAEHSGRLTHHGTTFNHVTSPKINLNLPQEQTTVRLHHRTGHHGYHKAPSTESPSSTDDKSDDTGSDVGTKDLDAMSESTSVANHTETEINAKKYKKTLDDWSRKTTDELMNQPEVTCACENGGSCILRVVCVCPKEYYGTRCQHKLHHHSCGDVRHGTWIRHGCTLCRCQDGNMLCMTKDTGDCDEVIGEEEVILEPETPENGRIDTYILQPPTPSLRDIDIDAIDSDMLVFEFKKLSLPSKANSELPKLVSPLLVFTVITSTCAIIVI